MTADTLTTDATALAIDNTSAAVKFHLALSVSEMARSVFFYRVLFGQEPARQHDDYAKFEVDQPPLVLSLIPGVLAAGGALNHLGLRLADSLALVALQRRFEAAGIKTMREDNVACCHSRQTKFWVTDPDRTLWEIYILHADADDHGAGHLPTAAAPAMLVELQPQFVAPPGAKIEIAPTATAKIWQHLLIQPIPERIAHADDSVDEARLEGTLNLALAPAALAALLAEIYRVLRPGGRLLVHGLVSDRQLAGPPDLPGPAALVQYVPLEPEPAAALVAAGFVEIDEPQPRKPPCFLVQGAELREQLLAFRKNNSTPRPR